MKKRLLSMLMVLCMVLTLLPVSVLAAEEGPYLPEGEIEYGEDGDISLTRIYRIYDDQIFKILHFLDVDVTDDTEIEAIKPTWGTTFGYEGSGSYKSFSDVNREIDYWDLSVSSFELGLDNVQPDNLRQLTITYDNNDGQGEKSVSINANELRCLKGTEAGYDHHYVIE